MYLIIIAVIVFILDRLIRSGKIKPGPNVSYSAYFTPTLWARLRNFVFGPKYDMDTLDGINRIPVPAKNYLYGDWTVDRIDYVLQKKATEHKENGRMDLAIACLRKSNELIDLTQQPFLGKKEYMRLYSYLRAAGQFDEAKDELARMEQRHPDWFDKDIARAKQAADTLDLLDDFQTDLAISTHAERCSAKEAMYRDRIYSISGNDSRFPKLPVDFFETDLGLLPYYEGISSPPHGCPNKDVAKYSSRPFVDDRTPEQKAGYEANVQAEESAIRLREEYEWLQENLPDICPKSLSGYSRMKNSRSKNFEKIVSAASEKGYEIE